MNSKSLKGKQSGGKVGVNSALQVPDSNEVEQIENVNPSPNCSTTIQMGDRNINSAEKNYEICSNQISKNYTIRDKALVKNYHRKQTERDGSLVKGLKKAHDIRWNKVCRDNIKESGNLKKLMNETALLNILGKNTSNTPRSKKTNASYNSVAIELASLLDKNIDINLKTSNQMKVIDTVCGRRSNDPSVSEINTNFVFSFVPHEKYGHLIPQTEQETASPETTDVSMKNCEDNGVNSSENDEPFHEDAAVGTNLEQSSEVKDANEKNAWTRFVPKENKIIYVPLYAEDPQPSRSITFTRDSKTDPNMKQIVHMHNVLPKPPKRIYEINIPDEDTVPIKKAPKETKKPTTTEVAANIPPRPYKPRTKKRPPPKNRRYIYTHDFNPPMSYSSLQHAFNSNVDQEESLAVRAMENQPCKLPRMRLKPRMRITPWEGSDHRSFVRYVKMFGRDFNKIAMRLGDKSVKQVSEFFQRYNRLYQLDKLASESEAKSAATQLH